MLKPVERQRVAEEIVEQLRSLILTGAYRPGDKLPAERTLAKQLGVNRASLREALKKLEHQGLVKIRQGDGTRVQDYRQTGGLELVSHLIPLVEGGDMRLLRDVLEFRRIYGREIARLAAARADANDRKRLTAIADEAANPEHPPEEVLRLDFEFYVALSQASKNQVFALLINTTRAAVLSHTPFLARFVVAADVVRKHHRALLDAIVARDADTAARIADEYMGNGALAR
jgi:DNA-binding FadR family transcriptional regulator